MSEISIRNERKSSSCLSYRTLLDGHWSDGGTSTDLKPGLLTLCEPIAKAAAGGSFVC